MKYQKKGIKGVFISLDAIERLRDRGGSNLLKAFFLHLKGAEQRYCNRTRDYFSQSDAQVRGEMGVSKHTVIKLKRELVSLGLAEVWQDKLPASKRGRKLRRTTPHITYYRLLY